MKTLVVLSLLMLAIGEANAQSDTTQRLPDSVLHRSGPDPASWYNSELPKDAAPLKDSVALDVQELPSSLQKTLDSKRHFDGWRRGKIYFDKVNNQFRLFIPRGKNVERFILDQEGEVLAYTSFIPR